MVTGQALWALFFFRSGQYKYILSLWGWNLVQTPESLVCVFFPYSSAVFLFVEVCVCGGGGGGGGGVETNCMWLVFDPSWAATFHLWGLAFVSKQWDGCQCLVTCTQMWMHGGDICPWRPIHTPRPPHDDPWCRCIPKAPHRGTDPWCQCIPQDLHNVYPKTPTGVLTYDANAYPKNTQWCWPMMLMYTTRPPQGYWPTGVLTHDANAYPKTPIGMRIHHANAYPKTPTGALTHHPNAYPKTPTGVLT